MKKRWLLAVLITTLYGNSFAQDPEEVGKTGTITFNYKGKSVNYTTVKAKDGNIWLQQNLGSVRVARNNGDPQAAGDYFNWGRWDDGHQYKNTTSAESPSPNNPSGLSKTDANPWYTVNHWWGTGTATDTWTANSPKDVSATNGCDPCKQLLGKDWHVPTEAEFSAMVEAEGIINRKTGFTSNLKFTHTGFTGTNGGSAIGTSMLWTSTAAAKGQAKGFAFSSNGEDEVTAKFGNYGRGLGFRVRCVKVAATKK